MKARPRHPSPRRRSRPSAHDGRIWLSGLHAVRAALLNPNRGKFRLVLTRNSANRLAEAVRQSGMEAEISDARRFAAPLGDGTVHQGAALEVAPLEWKPLEWFCERARNDTRFVLLDRVSDPHNVGAVIRSAAAFGATAIVAPARHAPAETGAMAKSASGAMEEVAYLRVRNLAAAMESLRACGFELIGFSGDAEPAGSGQLARLSGHRVGLVFGSEGEGMRELTRKNCTAIYRLCAGSLNVSNATAIALYATS